MTTKLQPQMSSNERRSAFFRVNPRQKILAEECLLELS